MALIGRAWRIKSSSFSSSSSKSTCPKKPASTEPERRHQRHQSSTNEPTSPRVSCMGQIKRCKLPPPLPLPNPPPLRPGFSFFPVSASFSSASSCCSPATGKSKKQMTEARGLRVEEMDPPLPVEKRKEKPYYVESLWRRRCRDRDELTLLELCQPVRLPAACYGVVD
ncbi:hypothetical protein KFK09_025384 [Dendrobium nobile]|uniref:Uncharacterized protein n=1 Tax=Dendrobium nobile TaxID=94219 RepID=A0A8T3AGP6_DENNO|nr:hypothetical protein KFK09_025384 [Dendrobium nobile]